MKPNAVLINKPCIDFKTFLGLSYEATGRRLASKADASTRDLSDAERFISCLAAIRDPKAAAVFVPSLLTHVSFSLFLAADEGDMIDILQASAGMPFVMAETIANNVKIAVITGTLAQWRDAVTSGSTPSVLMPVRQCFNKIYALFEAAGLDVWTGFRAKSAPDQTFYLEDKRNR
jgi:hypothetical protein